MFIQIMNRMMNEAICHPLAGEIPRGTRSPERACRSVAVAYGPDRAPVAKRVAARSGNIPATFRIYASAFNAAVHGG